MGETRQHGALYSPDEMDFGSVLFAAALHFGVSYEDESPALDDFVGEGGHA